MLKFLGHGSAFAVKNKNNSAFFKNGDELFLFDCGETVFKEIYQSDILSDIKRINIILTHFHTDHCGSLGTLVFYLSAIGYEKQNIRVIYPNKQELIQLLKLLNIYGECDIVCEEEIYKLKLIPFKQKHSNIFSFGYLFYDDGVRCYFSGDTCEIPKKILSEFLDKKIQYMYIDTRIDKKNDYHITLDELKELIPYNDRRRVICMHTADIFKKDDFAIYNFSYAGDLLYKNQHLTFDKEN